MTSGPEDDPPSWRVRNPRPLVAWAFDASTATDEGTRVLEFVRDAICREPDQGQVIDRYTRRAPVPGTDIRIIWEFDPELHAVEVIAPPL
jgi:hypothetical protein